MTGDRYECLVDPFDLWTVWDTLRDAPAESADGALIGLTKDEASAHCRDLNWALSGVVVLSARRSAAHEAGGGRRRPRRIRPR